MTTVPAETSDTTNFTKFGVVPVIVLDDPSLANPLADALAAGGIPCAEVTLRSASAMSALAAMASRDDLIVGAGTVMSGEQAAAAIDVGAKFLVSPGLCAAVVEVGAARGVPVVPGVVTPTEIMTALDLGLTTLKFFPAGALGGVATVKALAAAFPHVRFMPTGGIDESNARDYLSHPSVAAIGGSWLVSGALIKADDFAEIERLTAAARALVDEITSPHAPA